jgi:hypothetical protein
MQTRVRLFVAVSLFALAASCTPPVQFPITVTDTNGQSAPETIKVT